ncbi:MAG: cytochrome P450 [Sphingomonadales bacterium]
MREDAVSPDLMSADHIECPYRLYRELHRGSGVAEDAGVGVVVAGYQDLVALARKTELYSSSLTSDGKGPRHMGVGPEPVQADVEEILSHAHPVTNALFTADPPVHTRHRKLISTALGPRRVRSLEPAIRRIANDLVDGFIDSGEVDLLPRFAIPLPVTVISDILGVDRADMATFKHWGDMMIAGNIDVLSHEQRREVAHAVVAFHAYFVPRIEERRARPVDDLLSDMINAETEGEGKLSTAELLPIISQILLAGHETTTNLIGNAIMVLLRDAALMARLRERPELIEAFVEEMLRFDPPIQCTYRRVTAAATLRGVPLQPGQMVVPLWAAAGWDPSVFENPEKFDVGRANVRQHMGFGYGPHFCAGAELARVEARVAFETLLGRLDDIALDEGASDLRHLPSFASHGYRRLVLRFRERAPAG